MSEEIPERASSPHFSFKYSSVFFGLSRLIFWISRTIDGSMVPLRVPIGKPSSGVKPIVVSIACPPSDAVIDEPFPR